MQVILTKLVYIRDAFHSRVKFCSSMLTVHLLPVRRVWCSKELGHTCLQTEHISSRKALRAGSSAAACCHSLPVRMRGRQQASRSIGLRATQVEELAAAHHREGQHAPPAALICAPITAESLPAAHQVCTLALRQIMEQRWTLLPSSQCDKHGSCLRRLRRPNRSAPKLWSCVWISSRTWTCMTQARP